MDVPIACSGRGRDPLQRPRCSPRGRTHAARLHHARRPVWRNRGRPGGGVRCPSGGGAGHVRAHLRRPADRPLRRCQGGRPRSGLGKGRNPASVGSPWHAPAGAGRAAVPGGAAGDSGGAGGEGGACSVVPHDFRVSACACGSRAAGLSCLRQRSRGRVSWTRAGEAAVRSGGGRGGSCCLKRLLRGAHACKPSLRRCGLAVVLCINSDVLLATAGTRERPSWCATAL